MVASKADRPAASNLNVSQYDIQNAVSVYFKFRTFFVSSDQMTVLRRLQPDGPRGEARLCCVASGGSRAKRDSRQIAVKGWFTLKADIQVQLVICTQQRDSTASAQLQWRRIFGDGRDEIF
jgi:hypothetical protein